MNRRSTRFAALLVLAAASTLSGCADPEPKITEADARATALDLVPGAAVESEELEEENGLLIYSYDLSVPGRSGIEEVAVNATTGKVVSRQHETPADEGAEAQGEHS